MKGFVSGTTKFDAIVVGAGPAGSAAAYVMAKMGLDVLLFERGEYPGSKNMFGGVLYGPVLNHVIPDFWRDAPVERPITRRIISFVSEGSVLSLDYGDEKWALPPYNGFSLYRSRFDSWLAGKAVEAGATLVPETLVDEPLIRDGRVVGVRVARPEGDAYADVVVFADGANSLLAQKAGLRPELHPDHASLGVRETVELPAEKIEERFGISGNQGVANEFIGCLGEGLSGGGFLYTNRNSVSVGVVVSLGSLKEADVKPFEALDRFKGVPGIEEKLRDGVVREYSAHLVPEGGFSMMPKLVVDGALVAGDAAGFVCNTGISLQGMNFAIASGVAAAETVVEAKKAGDFSQRTLRRYLERLESGFVLQDLRTFKRAPVFLLNPRLYRTYPDLACSIARGLFSVDGKPRKRCWRFFLESVKRRVGYRVILRDLVNAMKSI